MATQLPEPIIDPVYQYEIKHNKLHSMQGRMVRDLEAKMAELQMATPPPQELKFLCDMQDLEEHTDYVEFQEFDSVASAPGELNGPRGVSIEAESRHIYVAEWGNCRIQIFSETGEYLNQFRHEHLNYPY